MQAIDFYFDFTSPYGYLASHKIEVLAGKYDLAKAIYKAYFTEDVNIAEAENVVRIAAGAGHEANAVRAALDDPALKDRTEAEVDAAIARGVFGSPYVIVDGEPFWGIDRFDQLARWLERPF